MGMVLPDWVFFNLIVLVKFYLSRWTKFGLIWGSFVSFLLEWEGFSELLGCKLSIQSGNTSSETRCPDLKKHP